MSDIEATAKRIYLLKAQQKAIDDEIKELQGTLPSRIDNYAAGDYIVKVQRNARFDAKTAQKNLPEELYEAILDWAPSSAKARAVLTDEQYNAAQKEFGAKVTVVRVEDLGV